MTAISFAFTSTAWAPTSCPVSVTGSLAAINAPLLHGDDACVLADCRRQQQLGRHGPPCDQHLGQQRRWQLPDFKNVVAHSTWLIRLAATDGIGSGM